jgi:two-component system sensor histidine kinase KdpD
MQLCAKSGVRENVRRTLRTGLRIAGSAALMVGVADLCHHLGSNRTSAGMILLLGVLGIAILGDSVLALLTSIAASLAFSWYFVDTFRSFRITTVQGGVTFGVMVVTALTGSQLASRAQTRAREAIRRREEMERLQQLGRVLLGASTVADAAEIAVTELVKLFGVDGARLRIEGRHDPDRVSIIRLNMQGRMDILELYGPEPSEEVRNALASMISLVLERARSSDERARIEAAQRGEELRSTVLNALAHNFKTPLTSIKAAASVLRGSPNIPGAAERELVAVIDEEADRLEQLIRESLDLARIESRRADPRIEECRIAAIVELVRSRMARYLVRRQFVVDLPDDLPAVNGDPFLLEQMLMQVLDNAWKYSRPGALIQISAKVAGDHLILTVRNEGSEIPACERDRIFDKFYRGTKDRARIEGTGLGLAIARTIAEASGGRVWLDPEPAGPAFRFALPLSATGKNVDREPHYIAHR